MTDGVRARPVEFLPHDPADGVYPATADYVHAMEVRDAGRPLFQDT